MADQTYDVIVIGSGHNGLIAACYLAWAGLKVAVFERDFEVGGGACSEEQPLPAFLSNPCASFTRMYTSPAWEDFQLSERGAWYYTPDVNDAVLFDDGTFLVIYPVFVNPDLKETVFIEENMKKNYENISKISRKDADKAIWILEKYQKKWRNAVYEFRMTPPSPWGVKDPIERLLDDPEGGVDPAWQFMTVKQVAFDVFESTELRLLYMRYVEHTTGLFPQDVLPLSETLFQLAGCVGGSPATVVKGGVHSIAHALQKALTEHGGEFFVRKEVDEIAVENGIAKGVRLKDGSFVEARRAVVSAVPVTETFFRFLRNANVSEDLLRKVGNFSYDRGNIFWAWFALDEPPVYKGSEKEPDLNRARRCWLLPKDLDFFASREQAECFVKGIPDKLFLCIGQDTLIDSTRTPKGKHNFLVEQFTAPARFFSEREWLRIKKEFAERVMVEWQRYAPNLTREKFIDAWNNTPYDVVFRHIPEGSWTVGAMIAGQMGRLRPCYELSTGRTPIKNLYLSNATQHYGGGLRGVVGYVCYKVMAQDMGLRKIWEEKGRAF